MRAIVLVEGRTDELALTLAAGRLGHDLDGEGVSVVPIQGAHAIGRFLRQLAGDQPDATVAGLYDAGEEQVVRRALERAGRGSALDRNELEELGFFACVADLEDELIRAAGEALVSKLIEDHGDTQPWRRFQAQRPWRGRPVDQQFRRFIRSVSERNSRYVRAIVETVDVGQIPRPIRLLLDYVGRGGGI